jgi:ribose 5-phosphate isomerase B
MKIFIGSDHNGFRLKKRLLEHLDKAGYETIDGGDDHLNPDDDFPVFASRVVTAMLASDDPDPRGILLCGSGQGMAMAANRHRGIRAAVCWDREQARLARNDDDANVLALPARVLEDHPHNVSVIVETFINTPFAGAERYKRRIKELDAL